MIFSFFFKCTCIYSWSQKFAYTLQDLQNADYFDPFANFAF